MAASYSVSNEMSRASDHVTFACHPGYLLVGNATIVCLQNGTWSLPEIECRELTCGDPPAGDVQHAVLSYKSYYGQDSSPGDYVIYSCAQGYQLIGNATIYCKEVAWSRMEFICQRLTCGEPPLVVSHAFVAKKSYESAGVSLPGASVTFACRDGYNLIGNATISCQGNVWSPPMFGCRKTRRCAAMPPTPDNAEPIYASFNAARGEAADIGDYIVYSCKKNFLLNGPSNVTCVADDVWSQMPDCFPDSPSCSAAPIVQNAYVESKSFIDHGDLGDTVSYKCAVGFILIGAVTITCKDGGWTPTPVCQPSLCRRQPLVANGTVRSGCTDGTCQAGEQVVVTCLPGFVLVGSAIVTCVGDNAWSDLPVCLSMSGPSQDHSHHHGHGPKHFSRGTTEQVTFAVTQTVPPPIVTDWEYGNWPKTTTARQDIVPEEITTTQQPVTSGAIVQYPSASPPSAGSFASNIPLSPDTGCYVGPYIPSMVSQNEPAYILSSTVHVFPDLMFACSGTIRRWTFYCLSRYTDRSEIYLDVWRPQRQIGATRFDYQLIGSNLVRSMVYGYNQVDVAPGQQLEVKVGDVIGFHYQNASILQRFLVIPMADESDPWPFVSSDLVRVLSNISLSHDDIMQANGIISLQLLTQDQGPDGTGGSGKSSNMMNVSPRRQLPLLQAIVLHETSNRELPALMHRSAASPRFNQDTYRRPSMIDNDSQANDAGSQGDDEKRRSPTANFRNLNNYHYRQQSSSQQPHSNSRLAADDPFRRPGSRYHQRSPLLPPFSD